MRHILCTLCALALTFSVCAQTYYKVIPTPQSVKPVSGKYVHKAGDPFSVKLNGKIAPEGYVLKVTQKGISIEASTATGVFYAKQTIKQMAGDIFKDAETYAWTIDCCTIKDEPRFPYRGLHMDVSRHFRSKEFILRHLDAMAAFKLNRMHWHLTDGAGWRLQIDSYPLLTEKAAWRTVQFHNEWRRADRMYSDEEHGFGGFYTKEDVKEIVEYAAERGITVIPEIEIPGHSNEVLAVYPEFGCTGVPYECTDLCPGKEATFEFIEKVLTEVMEMFPSEYIHIGGDEAGKRMWRTCPDCQKRMKDEGLKDVNELQSYMIKRVERFLESHGRHIIGWDEILDGGLAPNATVMSWRTTEGGTQATALGHDAIMTPQKFSYIDAAQDKPDVEPAAFGLYLPLQKMWEYNPTEGMPDASHIIGVQANLWSEYVVSDEYAEYMYWPRGLAVAETGWTELENKKDYEEFRGRALDANNQMARKGYHVFDLANEAGNRPGFNTPVSSLATGCPVTYNNGSKWNSGYPAQKEATLTDGWLGGWSYRDDRWQGFMDIIDVTVDLQKLCTISHAGTEFLHVDRQGMRGPEYMEIQVSADGQNFTTVATFGKKPEPRKPGDDQRNGRRPGFGQQERKPVTEKAPYQHIIKPTDHGPEVTFDTMEADFSPVQARYVRFVSERGPMGGWNFMDEIIVK